MDSDLAVYANSFHLFYPTIVHHSSILTSTFFASLAEMQFWEDVFPSYERKWRSLFDLVFFTVVVLILLNLLFGVIIDTFSELRQDRQAASNAWESNCFICGLDRMVFDRLPVGFKRHRDEEHCPFHYLYFIAYVLEKDETEFTGMEQYLYERIQKKDASFFPIHRAMALKDRPLHVQ
jgi:hypothetical protein